MSSDAERLIPARRYIPALDGLRAVAVLLVFGTHSVGDLFHGGFIGVDIFFVLSGFLITSLLCAEWSRKGTVRRGAFYARRALRLYPALLLALMLEAAIVPAIGYVWKPFAWDVVTSLTYTYNFYLLIPSDSQSPVGHFWSLSVEEQYYLVWPLLILWLLRRGGPRLAIIGTAAGIAGTAVLKASLFPVLHERLYFLPIGHADELLVGSLLGLLLTFREVSALRRVAMDWRVAWLCTLPLLAVLALHNGGIRARWLYSGGLLALAIVTVIIIMHLSIAPTSAMAWMLNLKPVGWLGRRSYAFYLFHQPVIILFREQGLALRFLVPAALAATCVLIWISFKIEQRVLQLKVKFEPVQAT